MVLLVSLYKPANKGSLKEKQRHVDVRFDSNIVSRSRFLAERVAEKPKEPSLRDSWAGPGTSFHSSSERSCAKSREAVQ